MLGVYRLTERIAAGGMGVVYRGERADGLFEQAVAVKLIRADCATRRNPRQIPPSQAFRLTPRRNDRGARR